MGKGKQAGRDPAERSRQCAASGWVEHLVSPDKVPSWRIVARVTGDYKLKALKIERMPAMVRSPKKGMPAGWGVRVYSVCVSNDTSFPLVVHHVPVIGGRLGMDVSDLALTIGQRGYAVMFDPGGHAVRLDFRVTGYRVFLLLVAR